MQIHQAIKIYQSALSTIYESNESRSIAELVLMHIFNFSKTQLLANDNLIFNDKKNTLFENYLKRLIEGEPVQYVLGETEFFGLKFIVNNSVLIPRPETEELIDWILSEIKNRKPENSNLTLLDIGTGSGCIPVVIKKNMPLLNVFGLDISPEALAVAKRNANLNTVEINFIEDNILNTQNPKSKIQQFDVIVSNPPYVLKSEIQLMHKNVTNFEPHLALFVEDNDALLFYRYIADYALQHLSKGGKVYFEINEAKGNDIFEMLLNKGFQNIVLKKDMFGKVRMVSCQNL